MVSWAITITIRARTIEVTKSIGLIGVTNKRFNIPRLLNSTTLKPLPAILRFISINAIIPGNKKLI